MISSRCLNRIDVAQIDVELERLKEQSVGVV